MMDTVDAALTEAKMDSRCWTDASLTSDAQTKGTNVCVFSTWQHTHKRVRARQTGSAAGQRLQMMKDLPQTGWRTG